jgi:hypothetical protein
MRQSAAAAAARVQKYIGRITCCFSITNWHVLLLNRKQPCRGNCTTQAGWLFNYFQAVALIDHARAKKPFGR